jgi:hypothetical protein
MAHNNKAHGTIYLTHKATKNSNNNTPTSTPKDFVFTADKTISTVVPGLSCCILRLRKKNLREKKSFGRLITFMAVHLREKKKSFRRLITFMAAHLREKKKS